MVSARWHPNPSAQRWSSAYPSTQRQSSTSPSWYFHSTSFPPQFLHGDTLVANCPSLQNRSGENCFHMGILEGHSSSWGSHHIPSCFLNLSPSPKWSQATHDAFFSSIQLDGMLGLVNSTTDGAAEAGWVEASIGLASWPVGWSSIFGLVERTMASPLSGRRFKQWGSDATSLLDSCRVWLHASNASYGRLGPPVHTSWVNPSQAPDDVLFKEDDMLLHTSH